MNAKNIRELTKFLLSAEDLSDMLDMLRALLTESELEDIARRLQIVRMLKKGVPQREIAKELNVGVATVTRGSRELRLGRFQKA